MHEGLDRELAKSDEDAFDQAGVLPFRLTESGLEWCLISSTGRGDWIFPKGNLDPGEDTRTAAMREAFEEAGIRGEIIEGWSTGYRYGQYGCSTTVKVYLMEVTESLHEWEVYYPINRNAFCALAWGF